MQDYDDGPTAKARVPGTSVITHPDIRWGRCDIKSTNLLANVLANQAAAQADASEDAALSGRRHRCRKRRIAAISPSRATLYTTPLKANILPGITRNFLIRLAQQADIPVREQPMLSRGPLQYGRDLSDGHHLRSFAGRQSGRQTHRQRQSRAADEADAGIASEGGTILASFLGTK